MQQPKSSTASFELAGNGSNDKAAETEDAQPVKKAEYVADVGSERGTGAGDLGVSCESACPHRWHAWPGPDRTSRHSTWPGRARRPPSTWRRDAQARCLRRCGCTTGERTNLGEIGLRCSDLLSHNGDVIKAGAVSFEPDPVPMPARSSRGAVVIRAGVG